MNSVKGAEEERVCNKLSLAVSPTCWTVAVETIRLYCPSFGHVSLGSSGRWIPEYQVGIWCRLL